MVARRGSSAGRGPPAEAMLAVVASFRWGVGEAEVGGMMSDWWRGRGG